MEYFLPLFLNWKNPLATYAEKEYIHLPCCLLEQLCLDLRKLNIFLNADICKKTFFFSHIFEKQCQMLSSELPSICDA